MNVVRRWLPSQRGQTLIEFAFAAPLLLLFVLALVDFGIAIDRRVVLQHAVREGVRYASVGGDALTTGVPATEAEIRQRTAEQSQGILDPDDVQVCYTGTEPGASVRVSAHYEHDFVTGFQSFFDTSVGTIVMEPDATARLEQPAPGGAPPC